MPHRLVLHDEVGGGGGEGGGGGGGGGGEGEGGGGLFLGTLSAQEQLSPPWHHCPLGHSASVPPGQAVAEQSSLAAFQPLPQRRVLQPPHEQVSPPWHD